MDLFPMRRRSSYETWSPRNFRGIHAAPSPVASSASLRSLPLAILAALEYKIMHRWKAQQIEDHD